MPRDIHGFLGEGNTFRGEMVLASGFRVDGRMEGKIVSPSVLVVGPSGVIEAEDLTARVLSVSGRVSGRLRIEQRLEIRKGGVVDGTVTLMHPCLVIEPGGVLDGSIQLETSLADPGNEPSA
jgi:cytoskeletal protein CcmA (bactofilin family)